MKTIFDRVVTFFLCLGLLMIPCSASEAGLSPKETAIANDLISHGYTTQAAYRLVKFDSILKKMEAFGQKVDISPDGTVYIENDSSGTNHLSNDEAEFIITMLTEHIQQQASTCIAQEDAFQILAQDMEENPGKSVYTVRTGENSFLRATVLITDSTIPSGNNEVSPASSGPVISGQYQFFNYGNKHISYELEEVSDVYYARCQIEALATLTAEKMTLTKPDSAQASIGLISIQNASLNQKQTVATEVGDYCEISNNVVFAISGSAGVNLLKGLISISISGGDNWTQKAIIRAHKTSAYGIVWTLGDVYKI